MYSSYISVHLNRAIKKEYYCELYCYFSSVLKLFILGYRSSLGFLYTNIRPSTLLNSFQRSWISFPHGFLYMGYIVYEIKEFYLFLYGSYALVSFSAPVSPAKTSIPKLSRSGGREILPGSSPSGKASVCQYQVSIFLFWCCCASPCI